MISFRKNRHAKAVALLSVIMALAIVGILSGMFLGAGPGAAPGAKPWPQQITDDTRTDVCAANRRTAYNDLAIAQIDHGVNIPSDVMQNVARNLPVCPGEGKLFIHDHNIYCALHTPTPTFRSELGLE